MKQAPIYFKNGFKHLERLIKEKKYTNVVALVDENTHNYCLPVLLEYTDCLNNIEFIEVPAGESTKQLSFLDSILQTFSEIGIDRKGLLINLGGGVVTDLGGFAASIYKRGIDFVNIPTSLLAMVDASAGGKTGIDHHGLKNQIGTFAQPQMVIVHPDFLETLPYRQMVSGFAEMLKHGLIQSKKHWEDLTKIKEINPKNIAPLIEDSVKIKINVVEQDPTEKGLRKILNAGHTIGHAVETYYLNRHSNEKEPFITHGEAVAIGLIMESHLAYQKGFLKKEEFSEIFYYLSEFFSYFKIPPIEDLQELMFHDKKNEAGKIKFSLLKGLGIWDPKVEECTLDELKNAIQFYEENIKK